MEPVWITLIRARQTKKPVVYQKPWKENDNHRRYAEKLSLTRHSKGLRSTIPARQSTRLPGTSRHCRYWTPPGMVYGKYPRPPRYLRSAPGHLRYLEIFRDRTVARNPVIFRVARSEERRGGKQCVSTCRSRGSADK